MFKSDTDVGRSALPRRIELKPAETKQVAGGTPTLTLPPLGALPWPSPW